MGRYDVDAGIEGKYEPGSHGRVLCNLQGIRTARSIHQAEYEALLYAQEQYVHIIEDNTQFSAALLCAMHRDWLGNIYAWAGRYRQVEMAKGGFRWPPAMLVPRHMARLESGLLRQCTPCRPAPVNEVAERVAIVHAELLLIHPFREGNGRLARWLAKLMIAQAGLPTPDYGFERRGGRKQRTRYLNAVIRGYQRDYEPLRDFFVNAVERALCKPL